MFFFTKNKEIVLDCFTSVSHAYDHAKIDHAVKYLPDWWKKTPKIKENYGTIKNCVGLMEYYRRGIVIPSWFESEFTIFEENNPENCWWEWVSSDSQFSTNNSHPPEQFSEFAGTTGKNIKINSPWLFKTKEELYFSWTQPTWNLRNLLWDFTILPALNNFKYQHFTNINLFVENKNMQIKWVIPPLIPLVIMHPLTEKKILNKSSCPF